MDVRGILVGGGCDDCDCGMGSGCVYVIVVFVVCIFLIWWWLLLIYWIGESVIFIIVIIINNISIVVIIVFVVFVVIIGIGGIYINLNGVVVLEVVVYVFFWEEVIGEK